MNAPFTVFINGVAAVSDMAEVNLSNVSSLKFGHRGSPTDTPGSTDELGFFLNGSIDEVGLFVGRALSDQEIRALFQAGRDVTCKVTVPEVPAVSPLGVLLTALALAMLMPDFGTRAAARGTGAWSGSDGLRGVATEGAVCSTATVRVRRISSAITRRSRFLTSRLPLRMRAPFTRIRSMRGMTEEERFAFDLEGYLVIKQVLTAEQVAVLNALALRECPAASDAPPYRRVFGPTRWGRP